MSGKPYPEGVKEVACALQRLRMLEAEIARQETAIREASDRLTEAQRDRTKTKTELWKKLESMDLTSSGNFGFEERMTYFLRELVGAGYVPPPWGSIPAIPPGGQPLAPTMPGAPQ